LTRCGTAGAGRWAAAGSGPEAVAVLVELSLPDRRHKRVCCSLAGVRRGDEPGLVAPQSRRASDPLDFVDEPQSLLIDGRRPRNVQLLLACSRQALATPPARTALRLAGAMFTAVLGKTYRLSSQNQTFLFSGK